MDDLFNIVLSSLIAQQLLDFLAGRTVCSPKCRTSSDDKSMLASSIAVYSLPKSERSPPICMLLNGSLCFWFSTES